MKVLIVGGSGGIGLAMVKQLIEDDTIDTVYATFRQRQPLLSHPKLNWFLVDVCDEAQIEHLSQTTSQLDWVINTVGLLHDDTHQPEKRLAQLDSAFFLRSMQTNALATLLLAKHLQPLLMKSKQPKFASLSARVGSISDNRLGGWYSYRASKAALNMTIKTLSIEWSRIKPSSCVFALHPGTTDTALSKPFQSNVPEGKLFSPERVARQLLAIVLQADEQLSGEFLAYDGTRIEW